jgi:hypothetical protein
MMILIAKGTQSPRDRNPRTFPEMGTTSTHPGSGTGSSDERLDPNPGEPTMRG